MKHRVLVTIEVEVHGDLKAYLSDRRMWEGSKDPFLNGAVFASRGSFDVRVVGIHDVVALEGK